MMALALPSPRSVVPMARRARGVALAAVLLLHGALALGLGWQAAVLPGAAAGVGSSRAAEEPRVLWLRWVPAAPDDGLAAAAPVVPTAGLPGSEDGERVATPPPSAAERPLARSLLSNRAGLALDLPFPDIALAAPVTRLTLQLTVDATGQVVTAVPVAGAVSATALVEHLQAELEGATLSAAARRLCLHLTLDEREARLQWRLTEAAEGAACRGD